MTTINAVIDYASEYIWGNSPDEIVSPQFCVSTLPYLNTNCATVLITKLIGVAIICGAALNKAPVLFNIYKTRSGAGISTNSIYAETILYSNSAFYGILRGNPFTSWGENGIVLIQTMLLVFMLWKYKVDPVISASQRIFAILVYIMYSTLVFGFLPPSKYQSLMVCNFGALLLSRGSQIISTFQIKHTGNQSIITIGMNLFGTVIRIFTTLKEVGWDFPLLRSYLLSVSLNFTIACQYFYFQKNTAKFLNSLKKPESKKE